MNRFMVAMGFGSLSLFFLLSDASSCSAEMPNKDQLVSSNASGTNATGQPTITWHNSMETGWAESKRRKVPMVIFITTGRCRYCDAMKHDTWCDQVIGQRLADDFVAIQLTPQQNPSTLSRIKVKMFPTTLIGMPEGKIVDHRIGYQPIGAIHTLLSNARSRIKRR